MDSPPSIPEILRCAEVCRCAECDVKLRRCIADARDAAKKHYCYECKYGDSQQADVKCYKGWGALEVHMNKEHFHSTVYRCKVCKRGFYDQSAARSTTKGCKHRPGITPEERTDTPKHPDFEKAELRRKEVLENLREKHATILSVLSRVLSERDDYPRWKRRPQRYPSRSRRPPREVGCTGNDETLQSPGQEIPVGPVNSSSTFPDRRTAEAADRSSSTFVVSPSPYVTGFVGPSDIPGGGDLFGPVFPPLPVEATNHYLLPAQRLTIYPPFGSRQEPYW